MWNRRDTPVPADSITDDGLFVALDSSDMLSLDAQTISGVFSAVFYRNDVSRFDIEAGQVVVVAIIFQGANLQSCGSI